MTLQPIYYLKKKYFNIVECFHSEISISEPPHFEVDTGGGILVNYLRE